MNADFDEDVKRLRKLSRSELETALSHAVASLINAHSLFSSLLEQKGAPRSDLQNYFGNIDALFEVLGWEGVLIESGLEEIEATLMELSKP